MTQENTTVAYILTAGGLTFISDGHPISIATDHSKFETLREMLKEGGVTAQQLQDVLEEDKRAIENAIRQFDQNLSDTLSIQDGVVRYKDKPLNLYVADKLLEMVKQGFPVGPVVNFIDRLMLNPSYRAVQHLFAFLEKGKNPLTADGKFVAFKAIREDWKDIHSGTFDNSIGVEVEMPRNQVDENPNVTCSHGLHVCSYDYLPHFSHANGHVVLVEVDPADVVAIPADYNNTKMRVCKYKVITEYKDYYQDKGDTISNTALYSTDAPFAVEYRNHENDDFKRIGAYDTLLEAATVYEETNNQNPYYHVRLVNTKTDTTLDEAVDEELRDVSHEQERRYDEDDDRVTFEVYAYESFNDFKEGIAGVSDEDFGDSDDALDRARELVEDYPIVRVLASNGDVIKTYGYVGE